MFLPDFIKSPFCPFPALYSAELYAFDRGAISRVQNPVDKKVTPDSAPLRRVQGHLGLGDSSGHLLRGTDGALQCSLCEGRSPDDGLRCDCGSSLHSGWVVYTRKWVRPPNLSHKSDSNWCPLLWATCWAQSSPAKVGVGGRGWNWICLVAGIVNIVSSFTFIVILLQIFCWTSAPLLCPARARLSPTRSRLPSITFVAGLPWTCWPPCHLITCTPPICTTVR